jgi:phosphatidylserine decarboxylase
VSQFEAPIPGDLTSYKTFNQFFYRRLTSDAFSERCSLCHDEHSVVSPADCHLSVIPNLSENPDFYVKGCKFDLRTFLGSGREELAQEYADGTLLLFRLSPDDYHRFHFPFDCIPSSPVRVKGCLESVNPIAYTPSTKEGKQGLYSPGVQPLLVNERHFMTLKSDVFGEVLCVPVGAMMIGKIHETYKPDVLANRCDEMGYFAFGGSSLVLIFKKGVICVNKNLVDECINIPEYKDIFKKFTEGKGSEVCYPEASIKMGERIAVLQKHV